uniref:Uncharacterized protein n=1 Tax=Octopus bimaculoides TaxID=37653 RepID=A0A0L8GV73_OCTBM
MLGTDHPRQMRKSMDNLLQVILNTALEVLNPFETTEALRLESFHNASDADSIPAEHGKWTLKNDDDDDDDDGDDDDDDDDDDAHIHT